MNVAEFIRENTELLAVLRDNNITPSDASLLVVFDEYEAMKRRGFKITFAVEYLAEKHHISIATVYRAIKKFKQNISL